MISSSSSMKQIALLLMLALVGLSSSSTGVMAFAPSTSSSRVTTTLTRVSSNKAPATGTVLSERNPYNYNEGQSPWGLKKNAEIWNGRVSMMAFTWIFIQELIFDKGVVQGIQEGDAFFVANAVIFGVILAGLTGFLAFQGSNDYTQD